MGRSGSKLAQAFLEDHRHLTRGFTELIEALERDDVTRAQRIAGTLDRLGGSHIEFEETVFYPALEETLGAATVTQLYDEHQVGLGVIRTVLDHPPELSFSEDERAEAVASARTALDHAVSCATLMSGLDRFTEKQKDAMLRQYDDARVRGRRWTELPRFRQ